MPIKKKIFLLIGRAIISMINNVKMTQEVQATVLNGEIVTGIERIQEYGFDTSPLPESEGVVLFQNGNRDQGICICVGDRRYRPTTKLLPGEVQVYDYLGNHMFLKTGNIIEIKTVTGNIITMGTTGISIKDLLGSEVTLSATGIEIKSVLGAATEPTPLGTQLTAWLAAHTHNYVAPLAPAPAQPGVSGVPNTAGTVGTLLSKGVKNN